MIKTRRLLATAAAALAVFGTAAVHNSALAAEEIKLRISASHGPANTWVRLIQEFYVPEVKKRVAARTSYKVDFIEGYGGSMLKAADSLEGVRAGVVDIAAYCFCFEPSNLPLHNFQGMLPFNVSTATQSLRQVRAVYDRVPFMNQQLEQRYGQKLLALIADPSYHLGTTFEWKTVADLKGKKMAAAGPNLWWLEYAGVTPVQSTLVEAYTSFQTGVYHGWVMHPAGWNNNKLHEVAKNFTVTDMGAATWHGLVTNANRFNRLPKPVQEILVEVGREYEAMTAKVNDEQAAQHLANIKAQSTNFRELPQSVRVEWATYLKDEPRKRAAELDKRGMPATQVLRVAMEEAEKMGYRYPVRYELGPVTP
jgi:C4-dicarboxylate-binding protein DctP